MADDDRPPSPPASRDAFVSNRGYWPPVFDQLLRYDPEFLERFLELANHPRARDVLSPKVEAFVRIVMNSSPAIHLSAEETSRHVATAFDHGATFEELLELFEILSVVGVHSVTLGIPELTERAGTGTDADGELSAEQAAVKEYFIDKRGFWDEALWGVILEWDHEFLRRYADFSAHPWEAGVLDPGVKELLYIAMDVGTPHFFTVGLGPHIENALEWGVTPEEILAVFEIQLEYGMHSVTHGLPILLEEAERRGALPGD